MATSAVGVVSGIADLFWTPSAPSFTTGVVASTAFSYQSPQADGSMRLVDDNGEQFIALTQLNLTAGTSTDATCDSISASISATIPQSEGAKSLTIGGNTSTLGTLAGASSGGGWAIRLDVTGQSIAFSFDDI